MPGAHGDPKSGDFDMVVLAVGVAPGSDTAALGNLFQAVRDAYGFIKESHNRISAVGTNIEGVYAAGCAVAPMDIQSATNAGKAAAGEILSALVPGEKLVLEGAVAAVDEELCTGCRICNSLCPYKAILFDEKEKISRVNHALCRGCGVCVAACPAGAILNHHFTREQILAEIAGVMS